MKVIRGSKFYFTMVLLATTSLWGQTNSRTNPSTGPVPDLNSYQHAEQIRAKCVAERRMICGRILQILPDGLVIECGYTDLLRPPLTSSWLVPGTVTATKAPEFIEAREPGSICAGTVILNDLPKPRGAAPKPKLYDYVIMQGYPAGEETYTVLGNVQKTVRRFSAGLLHAVDINLAEEKAAASAAGK